MQFDKPEHKELCLRLIEASNFPGAILDLAIDFKQAVISAEIKNSEEKQNNVVPT